MSCTSKSSKFYSKSLTLMTSILEMINQGIIAAEIARRLQKNKPHIAYYIQRAKDMGLVNQVFRDTFARLELTQAGKKYLLDWYDNNQTKLPMCRAENIQFRAQIIQMPTIPVDWKKIKMHNWVQFQSEIDSIKLKLNLGSIPTIEFLPSPLDGNDPFMLYITMIHECMSIQWDLYNKFGLKTDKLQLGSRGEWLVYDPIARAFCKQNGQVTYHNIGKVNASKPRQIGEFEFFDPRSLYDYMLMPQRLKNIEMNIERLTMQKEFDSTDENITYSCYT